MRCLVTGATGHIGAALCRCLVARGCTVAALVRPGSDLSRLGAVSDAVRLIHGDLRDLAPARAAVMDFAPEVVFHLAWAGATAARRNDPAQVIDNVTAGLALFDLVRAAGCRAWIGVGSQAEYGPTSVLLSEDLPARPATAYGAAKLCLGQLTATVAGLVEMRHVWVRLLATYGPWDDPRHLLPSVIDRLLSSERPALTPGEQVCDYLYVDDAAEALWRLAATETAAGVFVLGSGEGYTVRALVERARDLIDPRLPLGLGDVPYRPDQVMYLRADISKLRRETGWRPRVDLDEGLRRTVDWARAVRPAPRSA